MLPCPKGCEKSAAAWHLWSLGTWIFSALLAAVMIALTINKDRLDRQYATDAIIKRIAQERESASSPSSPLSSGQ
ncbi:unnamed protein product, partial [Gongylonema pulchrum]